jgi:hypothetical protein
MLLNNDSEWGFVASVDLCLFRLHGACFVLHGLRLLEILRLFEACSSVFALHVSKLNGCGVPLTALSFDPQG